MGCFTQHSACSFSQKVMSSSPHIVTNFGTENHVCWAGVAGASIKTLLCVILYMWYEKQGFLKKQINLA